MSAHRSFVRFFRFAGSRIRKLRFKPRLRAEAEALEAHSLLTSVYATIVNNTGYPLIFDDPDTQAAINSYNGAFTNNGLLENDPPAEIPNGGQGSLLMDATLSGVKGDFYFFVGNTGVKADLFLDNPTIGSNTYNETFSPNNGYFQGSHSGGGGVTASVTYNLSSIGGNQGIWGNVTAGPATIFGPTESIPSSDGAMNMLLLPNGTVMIHGDGDSAGGVSPNWYILTPDSSGSYSGNNVQVTTSPGLTMAMGRRFFASQVLPNDSVFVYGGEYAFANMTGNTTSGSSVITGLSSTAQLEVGMQVTGPGIPAPSRSRARPQTAFQRSPA